MNYKFIQNRRRKVNVVFENSLIFFYILIFYIFINSVMNNKKICQTLNESEEKIDSEDNSMLFIFITFDQ